MKDDFRPSAVQPNPPDERQLFEDKGERADDATYEDEHTSRRTVTIPLKEYDELKSQQHFIKDPSLISIIDKIEELIRALRKHIIRK